jgi:hypothetical protein
MINLQNERLVINIQKPGSGYRRSRFDWSGICQQITLDGASGGAADSVAESGHTFCSQEATKDEPGTEGVGLSDEFGITTPIGYDEIQIGGWFPKIGIGFLQKTTNEPYDFMRDYPMQTVPVVVEQPNNQQVIFNQTSEVCDGWGWRLEKSFSIDRTSLTIDYALENTSEKPLTTEQYNHNFLAIDAQTIGPAYQIKASFPIQCEIADGGIEIDNQFFRLTETPATYIYALQTDCTDLQNAEWELVHTPSGHGVHVEEQFSLFRFALWAKSHVISPEFFVWINLQPGETQTWQRQYTFF